MQIMPLLYNLVCVDDDVTDPEHCKLSVYSQSRVILLSNHHRIRFWNINTKQAQNIIAPV